MLLKNQLALEEIKREVKIYQKKKKNPINITYQILWDRAKVVP